MLSILFFQLAPRGGSGQAHSTSANQRQQRQHCSSHCPWSHVSDLGPPYTHTLLFIRYHPHLIHAFNLHLMTTLETHYCFPSTFFLQLSVYSTKKYQNNTLSVNPMLVRPCPISPKTLTAKKKSLSIIVRLRSRISSRSSLPPLIHHYFSSPFPPWPSHLHKSLSRSSEFSNISWSPPPPHRAVVLLVFFVFHISDSPIQTLVQT